MIQDQATKLTKQAAEIAHLKSKTHSESGIIKCGDTSNWKTSDYGFSVFKTVSFNHAYIHPPIIHMSLVSIDHWQNTDYNLIDFWIVLLNVTQTEFTMRCDVEGNGADRHFRYFVFDVSWLSVSRYTS